MVFTPDMDFTVQNRAKIFTSICQLLKNTAIDSTPSRNGFDNKPGELPMLVKGLFY